MLNPQGVRICTWFVMSSIIFLSVWIIRKRTLKTEYRMLSEAREMCIREGANDTYPWKPTLPDAPSDPLVQSFKAYEHWQEQVRNTKRVTLHIMLHIPGVMAIIALFNF